MKLYVMKTGDKYSDGECGLTKDITKAWIVKGIKDKPPKLLLAADERFVEIKIIEVKP